MQVRGVALFLYEEMWFAVADLDDTGSARDTLHRFQRRNPDLPSEALGASDSRELRGTGITSCGSMARDLQRSDRPGGEILEPGFQKLDELVALTHLGGHPHPEKHLGVVLHAGRLVLP
jgi:hypothetical protein